MRAVQAHLTDLGSCVGRDGTIYECGTFPALGQDWLVVVAETGAGTHPAQSVVTYAHTSLGPFEVQIFVGVGGSRKSEVATGSVVASNHVYMPYSGKYGDEGWSSRPRTYPIDNRLVGLARKICRDEEWLARIQPPLKGELPAQEVYPVPFPPRALVAPIVSVEAVSANPKSALEQHLSENYGDACVVEMEGYGAIFAANLERTPSILIRGISDMTGIVAMAAPDKKAEPDKTPENDALRQPVAACHAAAFGFELLSVWGQLYLLPLSPASTIPMQPADDALKAAPTVKMSNAQPAKAAPSGKLVVNLEGSPDEYPPERVAAILEALRKAAGSTEITIVRTDCGFFSSHHRRSCGCAGQDRRSYAPKRLSRTSSSALAWHRRRD